MYQRHLYRVNSRNEGHDGIAAYGERRAGAENTIRADSSLISYNAAAMVVTCPVQLNLEMYPVYGITAGTIRKRDLIEVPKAIKNIRILGLMAVISYMIVILSVWMYANFGGYVYFLAGEPNLLIKYTEWALGLTGILVTTDLLRKEIKEMA